MAQIDVDFCGRDLRPEFLRRTKHGVGHFQRIENVRFGEVIERAAGQALDNFSHENDAQIGINLLCAGLVVERLGKNPTQRVLFAF